MDGFTKNLVWAVVFGLALGAALLAGGMAMFGSKIYGNEGPILVNRLSPRAIYLESDGSAVMIRLFGSKLDVQVWEQDSPSPIRPKPLGDKPTWIGGQIGEAPKP